MTCSRRLFLLGTATTLSGALLAACSQLEEEPEHIAKFKAYSAECPHQGGTVDTFENGKGRCREHNSTFDLETGK